ncbi:hypothetical protein IWW39_002376 [Coemansia spiralis]|uniref:Uncharacterized protein n=1 Tax=Coemansia spiralis TaxID=417178 RepID=A0A9W8GG56_9FUNG|nr:hypothetical protein IWW39_002376 [Coemansia spiralis]
MSYPQMAHTQHGTALPWPPRHAEEEDDRSSEASSVKNHSGIGSLGLSACPTKVPAGSVSVEGGLQQLQQLQSPTLPDDMFFDGNTAVALPVGRAAERPPQLDFALSFEPVSQNSYALNPAFAYSWKSSTAPPVPQIPRGFTGSYVTKINLPSAAENKISFPRPDSDAFLDEEALTGETLNDEGNQHSRQPQSANEPRKSLKEQVRSYRSGSITRQVPPGKRNYSLPAALAPPLPRLEVENYEFSSIDRLERKWADVKTESTRMLSSAIYKYYFNHGEWSEFEQVFPTKVLQVWEEFQGKLSAAELAFVNTILVSQNPFSAGENGQEKHIPVLARTIPLSQVVRTMMYSDEMRSRESYSSLGGGSGPEIDFAFADWLVTHFNTMKSATFSPTDATFGDKHNAQSQQEPPKPEALRAAAEKRMSRRFVARSTIASLASLVDVSKVSPKPAKSEKPRRKKTVGDRDPSESRKSTSRRSSSKQPVAFEPQAQDVATPQSLPCTQSMPPPQRQPMTQPAAQTREPAVQVPALCATELNLPPPTPHGGYEASPMDIPVARSGSKSRRHTHNFFSSRSLEFRVSTDSLNSVCRVPREFQMKDLPPLPPNAAEISIMSKQNVAGGLRAGLAMAPAVAVKRENTVSKKPGVLSHFSSHLELNRKVAAMALEPEKPRSSSMTVDTSDGEKTRPNTARSTFLESRSTKASKSRASMAKEPVAMLYDWRHIPMDGDMDWGFSISSLVFHQPVVRRKASLPAFVVHANMPTLNRRELPDPQKVGPKPATTVAAKRKSAKPTIAPMATSSPAQPESLALEPPPLPTQPPPSNPAPTSESAEQSTQSRPQRPHSRSAHSKSKRSHENGEKRSSKSQAHLGLGLPGNGKAVNCNPGAVGGVKGVLYELAYLSTQGKNVWSKGEHIFAKMWKTGLEVNRIAEQDFYDFCVDELLKASNDAFQDLQAMGNKATAKKLYESFNAKLTVLLTDSTLE